MSGSQNRYSFTVDQFCDSFSVSRAKLYKLWATPGEVAPDYHRVGNRRYVSMDAALRWQRQLEQDARQKAA